MPLSANPERTAADHGPAWPRPRLRATLLLLAGFWGFWWLALTFYWWLEGSGDTLPDAVRRLPIMALGVALCLALAGLMRLLRRRSFALRAWIAALLLVPVSFVYAAGSVAVFEGFSALDFTGGHAGLEAARSLALKVIRWMPSLICCWAMVLALEYAFDVKEREERIAELSIQAHLAHLAALRFQVGPHFLFNALNSAVSLIVTRRPGDAEQLLRNLAAFLRATLAHAPLEEIALADELALQLAYLQVEKVRFPDRLRWVIEIDDLASTAQVPNLLLQPVVENAVKHGVGPWLGVATLTIVAKVEAGRLVVVIANDGLPATRSESGLGVGLANVRARLRAAYGEAADLEAGPQASGGYQVRIVLPYRPARHAADGADLPRGTPKAWATAET